MDTPKPGERWRITETAPDYTVIHEGVIAALSAPGAAVVLFKGANHWTHAENYSDRRITVERLRDPLPTAQGSLIKVANEYATLHLLRMQDGTWRSSAGVTWTTKNLIDCDDITVIYDASTEA